MMVTLSSKLTPSHFRNGTTPMHLAESGLLEINRCFGDFKTVSTVSDMVSCVQICLHRQFFVFANIFRAIILSHPKISRIFLAAEASKKLFGDGSLLSISPSETEFGSDWLKFSRA